MNKKHTINKHVSTRGFSLLELLIVMVIAGILMGTAVPRFTETITRGREATAMNELVAGISAVRTYAVTHKRPYVIQRYDGLGGGALNDWTQGYAIREGTIANPDALVQNEFNTADNITITSNAGVSFLRFDRLGRATPNDTTFTICNSDTNQAIELDVNIFGKTTVNRDANGVIIRVAC